MSAEKLSLAKNNPKFIMTLLTEMQPRFSPIVALLAV